MNSSESASGPDAKATALDGEARHAALGRRAPGRACEVRREGPVPCVGLAEPFTAQ